MNHSQVAVEYLQKVGELAELHLDKHLPAESIRPERVHKAMRYSMFAGGKRLRPGLAYAAFEICGGQGDKIFYATSALEMLHTFSLIHDDLPCMDDDDFRRGRPTLHREFDEATAVLAGDALCIHAFGLLAHSGVPETIPTLAQALGTAGMIGGQVVDIESEGQDVDLETVDFIHYHKTAALIEASLVLGAQIAHASKETQDKLQSYGRLIGLAFQVVDDILDLESTTEELGKDVGSDLERGKATYPSILGLEESKRKAREMIDEALGILNGMEEDTSVLESMAHFIITRAN